MLVSLHQLLWDGGGARDTLAWIDPERVIRHAARAPVMKIVVAAVTCPAALVLLLGAASTAPAATLLDSAPVAYPTALPAAATPFTGASIGCSVADPSGTGGCVTPATAWVVAQIALHFGPLPTSCWDRHAWNPTSDHPLGKACDVTFGRLGTFPGPDDVLRGWVLASWLRANAAPLQVSYVIWQGRIWSPSRDSESWRAYGGGGVYDASSPTGGHYDHVHLSTTQ